MPTAVSNDGGVVCDVVQYLDTPEGMRLSSRKHTDSVAELASSLRTR